MAVIGHRNNTMQMATSTGNNIEAQQMDRRATATTSIGTTAAGSRTIGVTADGDGMTQAALAQPRTQHRPSRPHRGPRRR